MKHYGSSILVLAASAGASLLLGLPSFAQTNSTGYAIYTQNYDGTVQTPTGTSGGPGKATVTAGQFVTLSAPRSANYNDTSQSAHATVTVAGTTQTVGGTTFTNMAHTGTQALNLNWQTTTGSATSPGLEGYTTSTSVNQRPIVDLSSVVSFNMYVYGSAANAAVNVDLEVEENTTAYYNADTAADTFGNIPTTVAAQPDILGMRGSDNTAETDIYIVGSSTPAANGYPIDGKTVTAGFWQTVTFNLPTDPHLLLLDSGGTTGYRTSGLGSIYGMDFTPVNPATGEVYSVYIDDLTIGGSAAPEPSAWALMGMGLSVAGVGAKALRKRRAA